MTDPTSFILAVLVVLATPGPTNTLLATAAAADGRKVWFSLMPAEMIGTAEALDMRDYGRLDVKLTPSGEWTFLEANPNPGLTPWGKSFARTWGGINYDSVVAEILRGALARAVKA